VLSKKLFRYKEFTIPFVVYREGELSREDFLQLVHELQDIQSEQHESLLATLEENVELQRNHRQIYESLKEVTLLFDEALDITEQALTGDPEEEDDLFEEAMETFKRGNLLLADAFYELDEMFERSNFHGQI
tara:strand:+ start:313 stop:708 length:396 start_codon:yes stop_codon:yes gene_type:complete